MKIAVIGCGLRTPLLLHGLTRSGLDISQIALYDTNAASANLMERIGRAIAEGTNTVISAQADLEQAIGDCSFVISSIRVGGMSTRARDERLALECGFAGQETTGPAGFAMALRTIPEAVRYARAVERVAPQAWIVNFTNPAGLITQAISTHTGARVVGICDTPAELFFRISLVLNERLEDVECDYFGLNHLGWVRGVRICGEEVMDRILADDDLLRRLYPAPLFAPEMLRSMRLLPTEYLFFYYEARAAMRNQLSAGATRGEELLALNAQVLRDLASSVKKEDTAGALAVYRAYLNRRNASYMHLEASGGSAFQQPDFDWDPFAGATGYHRIAVDAITALSGSASSSMVLNVRNSGCMKDLAASDVVEVPCQVNSLGPRAVPVGPLPDAVRGLTIAVKTYESMTIQAVMEKNRTLAVQALFTNPIAGDWDAAQTYVAKLAASDPEHLGYLKANA